MTHDAGNVMITREQALACLEHLGLQGPGAGLLTRAEALGHLLFLLEAGTLTDVDRLDQETLRSGYTNAAKLLVTGGMGIEGNAATLLTAQLLARVVEDRIRRTRLDLTEMNTPAQTPGAWSPAGTLDAVFDAVLTLLARSVPPLICEDCGQHELQAMREAIEAAQTGIRTALTRLDEGTRAVQHLEQGL